MLKQYHHIQVAVDGSEESKIAFEKAAHIAHQNSASLDIIHVIDTRAFQNVSSFDSAMVEQVSVDAEAEMKKYYQQAKEMGVENVKYDVLFGSPKVLIAHDYPKEHDIDLIILGATGLNAVERLLIGSVTEYVSRTAESDVLVVRTNKDNQPKEK